MKAVCEQADYEKAVYANVLTRLVSDELSIASRVNNLKEEIKRKRISEVMLEKKEI